MLDGKLEIRDLPEAWHEQYAWPQDHGADSRFVGAPVPKDIAAASGVALGTVRTQLKSVFAKTRSRRQAELVRLLITLCPG